MRNASACGGMWLMRYGCASTHPTSYELSSRLRRRYGPMVGVYNFEMRLTAEQIEAITAATAEIFGDDAQVWLFGSRADDARRGGDIDLYIETDSLSAREQVRLKSRLWTRLQCVLGERRIDIVIHARGTPMRPIDQQARNTGVRL